MGIITQYSGHRSEASDRVSREIQLARDSIRETGGLLPMDRFWTARRQEHVAHPRMYVRRHPTFGRWLDRDRGLREMSHPAPSLGLVVSGTPDPSTLNISPPFVEFGLPADSVVFDPVVDDFVFATRMASPSDVPDPVVSGTPDSSASMVSPTVGGFGLPADPVAFDLVGGPPMILPSVDLGPAVYSKSAESVEPAVAVPEPSTLILAMMAVIAWALCRLIAGRRLTGRAAG